MPVKRRRSSSGGSYAKRRKMPYRRPGYSLKSRFMRMKSRGFARKIKNTMLKMSETKYKSTNLHIASLNHDTLNIVCNMSPSQPLYPTQGSGDGNRIGDEIYITGFKIRGDVELPYDRKNVTLKFWVVEYDHSRSGAPTTYNNFFHNISGNALTDSVQSKRYKILDSWTQRYRGINSTAEATATTGTIIVNKWIPFRRKVTFQQDSATTVIKGMQDSLIVLMAPYDTYSSTALDVVVANSAFACTLYYKDP